MIVEKITAHKKIVYTSLFIVGILLVISIVRLALVNLWFQPHGFLILTGIPETVQLSVDDSHRTITINDGKQIPIRVGKRSITITADGFSTFSQTIDIKDKQIEDLRFILEPISDEAKKEYNKEKYVRIRELVAASTMSREISQIKQNDPMVEKLPLYRKLSRTTSCRPVRQETINNNKSGICIEAIVSDIEEIREVFSILKGFGYDLDQYDIFINEITIPNSKDIKDGSTVPCDSNPTGHCLGSH